MLMALFGCRGSCGFEGGARCLRLGRVEYDPPTVVSRSLVGQASRSMNVACPDRGRPPRWDVGIRAPKFPGEARGQHSPALCGRQATTVAYSPTHTTACRDWGR